MKRIPTRQRPRHELFYFEGELTCAIDWWLIGSSKNKLRVKVTMIRNGEDQERFFTALVTWSGCTDLRFGESGKFHLCGLDDLDFVPELMADLEKIRKKAIRSAA